MFTRCVDLRGSGWVGLRSKLRVGQNLGISYPRSSMGYCKPPFRSPFFSFGEGIHGAWLNPGAWGTFSQTVRLIGL
eukprot:1158811-Pelagomonas_calceolata.AAC.1